MSLFFSYGYNPFLSTSTQRYFEYVIISHKIIKSKNLVFGVLNSNFSGKKIPDHHSIFFSNKKMEWWSYCFNCIFCVSYIIQHLITWVFSRRETFSLPRLWKGLYPETHPTGSPAHTHWRKAICVFCLLQSTLVQTHPARAHESPWRYSLTGFYPFSSFC